MYSKIEFKSSMKRTLQLNILYAMYLDSEGETDPRVVHPSDERFHPTAKFMFIDTDYRCVKPRIHIKIREALKFAISRAKCMCGLEDGTRFKINNLKFVLHDDESTIRVTYDILPKTSMTPEQLNEAEDGILGILTECVSNQVTWISKIKRDTLTDRMYIDSELINACKESKARMETLECKVMVCLNRA